MISNASLNSIMLNGPSAMSGVTLNEPDPTPPPVQHQAPVPEYEPEPPAPGPNAHFPEISLVEQVQKFVV